MPLAPGARLGPYEILNPIGAGGMGEVYKARDPRLNRTVAIKLSKEAFSERFEREARAVAALNHPNICQIYDVGPDYLVMEFVDGAPVTPPDQPRKLLDIAVQIADGLAAAHSAGIIHRDLKPDNILMTREGRIKILDFGLAKAVVPDTVPDDVTRTTAVTDAGTTVGTIAYMSPEQARGKTELKLQSDQFSFGLVLYELATGHRAFRADSAPETMAAIIREDAEPLPAQVPAPLRWIIERLMAKDPADRYDSTRDLYRELRQTRERLSEGTTATHAASSVQSVRPATTGKNKRILSAAVAIALVAGALGWMLRSNGDSTVHRFTPMEVSQESPSFAVWSPDGTAFAYVAGISGDRHVFVRYLNSLTALSLTRSADEWYVAGWSSDSKRVIARGKNPEGGKTRYALFSVPVFGGEPGLIMPLDTPFMPFPSISADGKALVSVGYEKLKVAVYTSSPVGSPLQKYAPGPFETSLSFNGPLAQFAPDGTWITLMLDVFGGRQVWRLPYPPGKGAPERIMKGINNTGGTPRWSWFPSGLDGVVSSTDEQGVHLWFTGVQTGPKRKLIGGTPSESESQPSISPDGKKLIFIQSRTDFMIVSASLNDAAVKRVISSEMQTGMPAWASHQQQFVYDSLRSGSPAIWMKTEGGVDRPIVTPDAFPSGTTSAFATPMLSPNADRLVYTRGDKEQRFLNWISSVSGGPPVRLTTDKGGFERGGSWSPDGSKIVYEKFDDAGASVMVVASTGEATPVMLRKTVSNVLPEWSPDGQWIKFMDIGDAGWTLISPDGKTVRTYGLSTTIQTAFSADSKRLYGIRVEPDRCVLYSFDLASKAEKIIGDISKDYTPSSYSNPGIRLSLAPDGKSVLFPAVRRSSGLWMLEGFDQPGWVEGLRERLH